MAKSKPKSQSKNTAKTAKKPIKAAKPAVKSAVKAKASAKPAVKSKVQLKTVAKASVKSAKPSVKAGAAKAKPMTKLVVKAEKKDAKPILKKVEVAAAKGKDAKKDLKPTKPEVKAKVEVKKDSAKPTKVDAKSKSKTKKVEKKDEDFDDDLTLDDDFGDSEISDYEDDLKIVEEEDIDENLELSDDDEDEAKDEEIYLTDSEGRRLCRVRDCDQVSTVDGYCRYHYLLLWKKIQVRKAILVDGKLEKYVEDLTSRYPDKFLEMIRKDLKSEKEFLSAIQELEIDESALNEAEGDDEVQSFSDEIRGIGDAPTAMDDDGDY